MPHATSTPPQPRSADSTAVTEALLLITTGPQSYWQHSLALMAAAQPVVLIAPTEPTWEKAYIADYEVADPMDLKALRVAAETLGRRHRLLGVLTWNEAALVPAAHLAADLDLPGNSSATATVCRNKTATHAVLAAGNVPSTAWERITDLDAAVTAADRIGFPVVLKPTAHAAGAGVIRADGEEELDYAYAGASVAAGEQGREGTGLVIEEHLDGPEIAVECVTQYGVTTAVAIVRTDVGPAPHCEKAGHSVEAGDPLLALAGPVAIAALDVLGFANGVSHVQVILTDSGPHILGVHGRLADDLITYLVREATGIDLPRAAADIACGRTPDLRSTRQQAAAVSMLCPPTSGLLTRRSAEPQLYQQPWLDRLVWEYEVGDVIPQPFSPLESARLGHLVTTGSTAARCFEHRDTAFGQLAVTVEP